MKKLIGIFCIVAAIALIFLVDLIPLGFVQDAEAIAGVRRRTARRTAVVVGSASAAQVSSPTAQAAAAQQEARHRRRQRRGGTPGEANSSGAPRSSRPRAPAPTAMVASLPAGCVSAGAVFQCGNVYYKPYMSGSQIVYGVVPGP